MISDRTLNWVFLTGLLLMMLQFIQIGIAQPAQLWAVLMLAVLLQHGRIRVSLTEMLIFAMFMSYALVATFFSGYPHYKAAEQLMKFGFLYPAFFLVGRTFGTHYLGRALPYTYLLLWVLLGLEYLVQFFEVPYVYRTVTFMQGVLHGTFKERNWLAIYFFLASYLLFLCSSRRFLDVLNFMGLAAVVTLLSGSKTILIPCGIVLLLHYPGHWAMKIVMMAAGTALYVWLFGDALSGDMLRVRMEEERGLAFTQSAKLLEENWLGYGFGFVEMYFGTLWFSIKGLGLGSNSIFSSPLDLMLIAGIPGLVFWSVFFGGVGLRSIMLLAPIAAWSLTNPLHQSEVVYFFMGILVSWGLQRSAFQQTVVRPDGKFEGLREVDQRG